MAKVGKFSKKYGLFLSDASNEEVVSVSKELMNGISSEVRSSNATALGLLAASLVSLILMISLISGADITVSGTLKAAIFLTRILSMAMLCISSVLSGMVISKASDASSISTLMWRNVREMANDEMAYEQVQAIKVSASILSSCKTLIKVAAVVIAVAGLLLGIGFTLETLSAYGYI